MEQGLGSETAPLDKSRVLNVKPLRCLVPIFPSNDSSAFPNPQSSPFACAPPTGPFPSGVAPFYPFFIPPESQKPAQRNSETPASTANHGRYPIPSPVPLNSFRTPPAGSINGNAGTARRSSRNRSALDGDDYPYMHGTDAEDDIAEREKRKARRKERIGQPVTTSLTDIDIEPLVRDLLVSFNLTQLDSFQRPGGEKELVDRVLIVFNLLRRRIAQMDDIKDGVPGVARRPDLRAAAILLNKGARANGNKRIGPSAGVEVGDIFFFRMELCLVGLHSPSMSGIDYMTVKLTGEEEPLAVSIVSSGGYEDDGEDGEVLIYSGQGGKQHVDQKLERGNLALEKSLHRGNEVRVIRGLKDIGHPTGKVYVYDGLYKIHESWVEKGKYSCNVFKYKLVRVPGQPEAFTLWKSIQQWKDGILSREGVILPDLTSGAEKLPVCLVNDVDDEKGPAYFTYIPSLKYVKPFVSSKPSFTCNCSGGCKSRDPNCPCVQENGGFLPYTSLGVILSHNSLVHECGPSCLCPPDCRNRITQAGLRVHLEVFKTKNKGWGLRSWDPIRAGGFICEYAGEVIDASTEGHGTDHDDDYIFDTTRTYAPLEDVLSEDDRPVKPPFPLVITAKNGGNVARFMNHSCSPNVMWQPILRENNNESYLHVGFFAIGHIPPMQELTYNYGEVRSGKEGRRKKCLCGSFKCRGYFY